MSCDVRFKQACEQLGHDFEGEIKIGGNYVPLVRHEDQIYISGQIPRVGDTVVVTGRAGADVTLEQAQLGAKISALRAIALLQRSLGSLDKVRRVLRMTLFVQCTDSFTQQSEVADGASELLFFVFGEAGAHTRSSVGVYQLPKNATVEMDLIAVAE
ncbi:RidA family protein [Pseudomonas abietaniphila]|uniref:Enamine deaminase RidA, house cleaning of reactive enamine intermediates, YjgF/YER057c/UK114 family n=1 Tax=Pseudomonas abietaniphila TaxID=89065 RepID=A0A1G8E1Y8_9PSED|nr:RidA family protein [Pseudomonas abietaniphila]SDH63946.1 Enamine deaminase RidA, house cleaning of reactive enamine intermediates, YjgF/YER057c/UK114 family [Pseudomonas abietaniphila]